MTQVRATDVFLLVLMLGVLVFSAEAKRRARAEAEVLTSSRDSARRADALLSSDVNYLRRWARTAHPDSAVTLRGETLDGKRVVIRLSDLKNPLILYSFNPDCSTCFKNLPYLTDIARQKVCGAEMIGVFASNASRASELNRSGLPFSLLKDASGTAWDVLPLGASPTTILLGPAGRLAGWWNGELSPSMQAEIIAALQRMCG